MTYTADEWCDQLDKYGRMSGQLREAGLSGDPNKVAQVRQAMSKEWDKIQEMLDAGLARDQSS